MLTLYPSPVAAKSDHIDFMFFTPYPATGSATVLNQVANLKFTSFWLSKPSHHCGKGGHKGWARGYKWVQGCKQGGVIAYTQAWGHEDLCLGICNDLHPNHLVKSPLPNFWFSVLVQCTCHLWTQVSMWRYMHPWFLHLHHLWMQEDFFFLQQVHKRGRRLSRGCQHMILTKF